jgi:hypothetical protein
MSRNRQRRRQRAAEVSEPQQPTEERVEGPEPTEEPGEAVETAPDSNPCADLIAHLGAFGINVELAPEADEEAAAALLERLADTYRDGGQPMSSEEMIAFVGEAREAGVLIPEAEAQPEEAEVDEFDGEEGGVRFDPLALGIQLAEALLTEAKAGFIAGQVEVLEAELDVKLPDELKLRLAELAHTMRDHTGLPDVEGAYRVLIAGQ